nr:nucleotide exchange factor GrpE [Duncaniella sp.]
MGNENKHNPLEDSLKREAEGVESLDDVQEAYGEENSQLDEANDMLNRQESDIEALNSQLADAQAQVEKEKKEYLFLMAEFDNFRKRSMREKSEIIKNASESVLKGLLPIVDDFERALDATAKSDDPAGIREGMELIYQKLIKYLAQNGVTALDSTGNQFEPE